MEGIHCCICKGNKKSGCVCLATLRELFPRIKCYLCGGTEESGCNCHEGVEAVIAMGDMSSYHYKKGATA